MGPARCDERHPENGRRCVFDRNHAARHMDGARNAWVKHPEGWGERHAKRGSENSNSVLTASNVLAIRELVARGVRQRKIAERFGISQSTVSKIASRQLWGHI